MGCRPHASGELIRCLAALVSVAALSLVSCRSQPDSPEMQVRSLLERAEVAAEKRDAGALKRLVSETYTDTRGQDKDAIVRLLGFYFFRHKSIHLLTRVQTLEFPEPALAEVTVFVAMAGRPIPAAAELSRLRADLYRFDFVLASESPQDWQVVRAEWRRAKMDDFL
jgi:hypothetical protein